ncbi:hypothetical protein FHT44_002325 [Mycolicibacterium sp. BK634]|uniref:HEPN domain-containing protein n=1 Tax=Mycolicibacterium sp. BK634 TaxID=2587099 RepID=UPI00160986F7|nr:HEPN domain-containing protein [Mycolicibacterium sp. BK634]MBB3749864.1 hypothetical protein [Mycolicibacterium sp. BK634]
MTDPPQISDANLAKLAQDCVRTVLSELEALVRSGAAPRTQSHYVRIDVDGEGLRTKSNRDAPPDFGSWVLAKNNGSWETGVRLEDLETYRLLEQYLRDAPLYRATLSAEDQLKSTEFPEWSENWFTASVRTFVARLVDYHAHRSGWVLDSATFSRGYALIEPTLRTGFPGSHPLTVDVIVPLMGISFNGDPTSSNTGIELLEVEQLAASWPGHHIDRNDEMALLRCTHAWVQPAVPVAFQPLSGWLVASGIDFAPLERLLEVLAVSVHRPFGVKHVMYRPRGWAETFVGGVPAGGTWTWTYDRLAHGPGGSEQFVDATRVLLAETERRLGVLSTSRHEIQLAARRLLAAVCRPDPVDAVLDGCIGIEALVGDTAANEITYKLAIRSAAVLRAANLADAEIVFPTVKRLYSRRSQIVHGKLKPNDDNTIKALGGTFTADSVAAVLLGLLLQAVLDEPDLGNRVASDDLLLTLLDRRVD